MSVKNSRENKAMRRYVKELHQDANKQMGRVQPQAKYGTCIVTDRYTIVDHEHSISDPAWRAIAHWVYLVEKQKAREVDVVNDAGISETASASD